MWQEEPIQMSETIWIWTLTSSLLPNWHSQSRETYVLFFEERNHQKAINRLGEKDFGICHTEKLLLLNSYALTIGGPDTRLPYQVTAPRSPTNSEREYMGFSHAAMFEVLDVSNPTDSTSATINYGSDDNNEDDAIVNDTVFTKPRTHTEQQEILRELIGDDLDIEVFVNEDEYNSFCNNDQKGDPLAGTSLDVIDDNAQQHDKKNREAIEAEIKRLLPTISHSESTMDAFKRLTNQCAWIPFRDPSSNMHASDIDKAEADLYDEWMSNPQTAYSPQTQSGPRSFKAFEQDWNNEVTRRFRLWSKEGDGEGIVQLRYKTKLLLQQHFNKLAEISSLQGQLPNDDTHRHILDRQLRENRQNLNTVPRAEDTVPPRYHGTGTTPLGCPTGLNAEVTVGAVRQDRQNSAKAPFRIELTKVNMATTSRRCFRSRKYCINCGFKRSDHVPSEEGVAATCKRSYCGKCRERRDCHGNSAFGIKCTNNTHPWQVSTVSDWFETIVN